MKEIFSKEERWEKIRWLISRERISTQNELSKRLEEEGCLVTQATVSRDIKLLRLSKKVSPEGGYYYELPGDDEDSRTIEKLRSFYRSYAFSVANAQNLVVLRCAPGMAQGICATIDDMNIPDVLGSIAGDDTILIVAKDNQSAEKVSDELRSIVEE